MDRNSSLPSEPTIALVEGSHHWALKGELDIRTVTDAERSLGQWLQKQKTRALDLADLRALDTPGALLLCGLLAKGVSLTGVRAEHEALLDLVCNLKLAPPPAVRPVPRWRQLVIGIGRGADEAWHDARDIIAFVGQGDALLSHALTHPRELRPASISRHIDETGVQALPIVGLMAVMISVVIGYQGVAQLRPYGARGLHDQSRRRIRPARDGSADHRDPGRGPLRLGIHRGDRRDEVAGRGRRARR